MPLPGPGTLCSEVAGLSPTAGPWRRRGPKEILSLHGRGAFSLSLGIHLTYTVSCLSLPCLRDSPSMFVCVGPSQLLPTSVSIRLSVPPPHPHPFVCHQDSTLVTTGAKAGQQVCEGVGEGGVRLCGTSPPPPPSDADLFWYPPPLSQARHDLEL